VFSSLSTFAGTRNPSILASSLHPTVTQNRCFEQRLSFQPPRLDPAAISNKGRGIVLENFVINIYIFKNREKIF
jgi:hypothetical protein